MKTKIYQIDAFTDKLFGGNPAAVCPVEVWPADEVLLNIAIENNLAETAYFKKLPDDKFHLRWFTPELEMDLCGHATLASAYVIFNELGYAGDEIIFQTRSGLLTVKRESGFLEMDFPSRPAQKVELPTLISQGLNIQPKETWKARDYLLVYESENDINSIVPNLAKLNQLDLGPGGIIVTAMGAAEDVDFVSRFFTPGAAVFEDPVTGSAHCTLVPYWAERLNKTTLKALQVSARGGELWCQLLGDRVSIKGKAVKYMEGVIEL